MASIGSLEFETVIKTDSIKKSEEEIKKAVDEITKTVEQQSDAIDKSNNKIIDSAKDATKSVDKTMESIEKQADKIIKENNDVAKSLNIQKDALNTQEFKDAAKSVDDYTDSITQSILGNSKFGQSMVNLAKSGSGVNGLFDGLKVGISSFGKSLAGLLANPAFLAIAGIGGVVAGFKWWWDYNKGVEEATRLTKDFTGLGGDELKKFRGDVQALADVYGRDFKDVLSATDALVANWGMSFEDARGIIEKGFVAGIDNGGKYLEVLQQYPTQFKEMGVSAEQYLAIIQQTNSGIFSEKGMDSMVKAMNNIRNMSKNTATALNDIGLNSQKITNDLQNGNVTMFDVIQEITLKMKELNPESQKMANVISDVFGKTGVQSGQEMLKTFNELGLSLDDLIERQGEYGNVQQKLINSEKELNNLTAEVFDNTDGFFEVFSTSLKVLWNEFLINILGWFKDIKADLIDVYNEFVDMYNGSEKFRTTLSFIFSIWTKGFKITYNNLKLIASTLWDVIKLANPANWFDSEEMSRTWDSLTQTFKNYGNMWVDVINDAIDAGEQGAKNKLEKITNETKEKNDTAPQPTQKQKDIATNSDTKIEELLSKTKQKYEEYKSAISSTDKEIRENAIKNSQTLLAQGATWEEYLKNLRIKYKGNSDAIRKINEEILNNQKGSLMDLWQFETENSANVARNITEQLNIYQKARENIAENDPLKSQKNEFINDKISELIKTASTDYIDAQKVQREFFESSKKEWEKYADDLALINEKIATATNDAELQILNNQKNATEIRMNVAKNKDRIEQEKQLTDKLIEIELDRQKQIQEIQADESLTRSVREDKIKQVQLNAQNDIKIARSKFIDVDSDFIQTMLNDMQSVMGQQMNYYVAKIQELQQKLNSINPDTTEYMTLNAQLKALEQQYDNLKTKSLQSTRQMAKDKSIVQLKNSMSDFGSELQNIGSEIGGIEGDVISATGEMFNSVVSLTNSITKFAEINVQAIEGVSQAGATAIKTVEKASVILAIIGTIVSLINSLQRLNGNGERIQFQNDLNELCMQLREAREDADISALRNSKNSLFGNDAWGLLTTNINIAKDALVNFDDAQKNLIDHQNDSYGRLGKFLKKQSNVNDVLKNMSVRTQDSKSILGIKIKSAKYDTLSNLVPELFGAGGNVNMNQLSEFANSDIFTKLSQENQQLVNDLVEEWKDYNDAIEQVEDNFKSMFGDVGGEVMDSMVEMFEGGEDAINHFNDTWDKMIENMVKSMLFSNMIQPEIDKLTDKLETVGFFADPTANINKAIESIANAKDSIFAKKDSINQALQSFSELGNENGLSLFANNTNGADNQKTLSGAIKGASQESIDLLAGQTNAVRVNQVESISLLRQQVATNVEINTSIIKNGIILSNILDTIRSSSNLRSQGLEL